MESKTALSRNVIKYNKIANTTIGTSKARSFKARYHLLTYRFVPTIFLNSLLGILQLEARFLAAAITSNLKEVEICLEQGVNVNAYIRGGSNALHIAAERGDILLATTLSVSPKLNYNAKTDMGYTALMLACLIKNHEFVKFLLKHKSDPNMEDRFGKTALHIICRMNATNLALELLRRNNVDVNKRDCFGATPLVVAILEAKSLVMVKILVKYGSNLSVGPERSLPVMLEFVTLCKTPQDIELVAFLIDMGVDVNMIDSITKKTALHFVGATGFLPLAIRLINLGAKVNMKDVCGRRPSQIAVMHGNYETYQYLRREEIKLMNIDKSLNKS